jgi:hypothetical protein
MEKGAATTPASDGGNGSGDGQEVNGREASARFSGSPPEPPKASIANIFGDWLHGIDYKYMIPLRVGAMALI